MGFPQARGTVDEQGVVGPAGYLGHGLGGRVGEAVRRRGDEGVEGEPGIELDRGGLPVGSGVARDRARLRPALGSCLDGRVFGSGQAGWRLSLAHLELDGDVPAGDGRQGVLDHGQKARRHALSNDRVGHGEREDGALEVEWLDGREPHLPRGVGHLLTQRRCAARPQPVGIVHLLLRKPLGPPIHSQIHRCGVQRVPVEARTYTVAEVPTSGIGQSRLASVERHRLRRPVSWWGG